METHPSILIVTIREGEEQGICGATLKELSGVVKDQVEESSVVVIVLSKGLAMWRQESMNTLLHYVDVGETRVVTNS